MTLSEFLRNDPNRSITTSLVSIVDDGKAYVMAAQLLINDTIKVTAVGSGKTAEEAEDKAVERALAKLG